MTARVRNGRVRVLRSGNFRPYSWRWFPARANVASANRPVPIATQNSISITPDDSFVQTTAGFVLPVADKPWLRPAIPTLLRTDGPGRHQPNRIGPARGSGVGSLLPHSQPWPPCSEDAPLVVREGGVAGASADRQFVPESQASPSVVDHRVCPFLV